MSGLTEKIESGGRLLTIDFLRGIAALSITIAHAHGNSPIAWSEIQSSWWNLLLFPFSLGIARVYLFFIISGFSIHLRYAKSKLQNKADKQLEFLSFWKRRLWRLYPTYFVALLIYVIAGLLLGKIIVNWFLVYDVTLHLLMLHNIDARTVYSLNGAFWTLAVEEQIYLAYFLLLYLREKFGWKKTLLIAFGLRVAWFFFVPIVFSFTGFKIPAVESSVGTWCLWILGAISVEHAVGLIKLPDYMKSFRLAILTLIASSLWYLYGFSETMPSILQKVWWLTAQPFWGIGFFFLVNSVIALENKKLPWSVEFIFRQFAKIGIFSYSLYLMNEFIVMMLPETNLFIRVAVSIAFGYGFHLLFERPFMSKIKPYRMIKQENETLTEKRIVKQSLLEQNR